MWALKWARKWGWWWAASSGGRRAVWRERCWAGYSDNRRALRWADRKAALRGAWMVVGMVEHWAVLTVERTAEKLVGNLVESKAEWKALRWVALKDPHWAGWRAA